MKKIIRLVMMIPLIMLLACDEIVIGENPISIVGDTVYVFPLDVDNVDIRFGNYSWDKVSVVRFYEEGYSVNFKEDIGNSISKVVVTLPTGNVYILPVLRSRDDDDVSYSFDFEWSGGDYQYLRVKEDKEGDLNNNDLLCLR